MSGSTPNSYKDPYWQNLAAKAEAKAKLPDGFLRAIVNQGERSNNNQVSEAGAKTPFQIIPKTRDLILKKYGVDAYLSDENAAYASALVLKEGLDRNNGSKPAAAGEYHGGTDRKNWGPRTNAYIKRVSSVTDQQEQSFDDFYAWRQEKQRKAQQEKETLADFNAWKSAKQQQAPSDVPTSSNMAAEQGRMEAAQSNPEPSLLDNVIGAGEVGLSAITGAAGGLLGGFAGTLNGLVDSVRSGTFGTQQGVENVQNRASQGASNLTYAPRTEAGQEMLGSVGEAASLLPPVLPMIGQAGAISQSISASAPVARAAAGRAGQVATQAAKAVAPALKEEPLIAQQARAANIPLMTSDVRQPNTFIGKSAQVLGERIPIAGTGGVRSAQENARQAAIKKLVVDYGADTETKFDDEITKSLVAKRKSDLTKNVNLKADVFDRISQKGNVPLPNAISKINEELANIQSLGPAAPKQIIDVLENFKASLTQGVDIKQVESLRKLLGDQLGSQDMSSVKSLAEKIPQRVYGALKTDMGEFIKANGEPRDYAKWRIADRKLSAMIGELNNSKLKRVLRDGEETPENINKLLFSNQPSDVKRIYQNLDDEGKSYAKAAILKRAYDESLTDKVDKNVSTVQFSNKLRKLSSQTGVFFSKEELERINGLNDVLDVTKRASTANVMTNTGQQNYAPVVGAGLGSALGSFFGALATGGSVGLIARAYESAAMRNILTRLSTAKGVEKQKLLKQLSQPEKK